MRAGAEAGQVAEGQGKPPLAQTRAIILLGRNAPVTLNTTRRMLFRRRLFTRETALWFSSALENMGKTGTTGSSRVSLRVP
jgi:hypothetical protein